MPATKCSVCGQAHARTTKLTHAGKKCIFHDPDSRVSRKLPGPGLPDGCPCCLEPGQIDRQPYGRRMRKVRGTEVPADWKLTCRNCGVTFYWSEK